MHLRKFPPGDAQSTNDPLIKRQETNISHPLPPSPRLTSRSHIGRSPTLLILLIPITPLKERIRPPVLLLLRLRPPFFDTHSFQLRSRVGSLFDTGVGGGDAWVTKVRWERGGRGEGRRRERTSMSFQRWRGRRRKERGVGSGRKTRGRGGEEVGFEGEGIETGWTLRVCARSRGRGRRDGREWSLDLRLRDTGGKHQRRSGERVRKRDPPVLPHQELLDGSSSSTTPTFLP
jgi:hypothetical protein